MQNACLPHPLFVKRILLYIFIVLNSVSLNAQNAETKALVDSIYLIRSDSIDCSSDIYWRIVAKGEEAIPYLIEKLTDSMLTNVEHPCKLTKLTSGDIAFLALNQIADFPAFVVLKIQFDVFSFNEKGNLCWSLYDFAFSNRGKMRIQESYFDWWKNERSNYKKTLLKSEEFKDCLQKYKIKEYYRWKG
jgi:hypothetical protein